MTMRIKYETTTCSRCHGTRYFAHFSHVEAGRCFRCGGSGTTLTRKGSAAKKLCTEALTVRADALEPGMVIWETEVVPMTNQVMTRKMVVEAINTSERHPKYLVVSFVDHPNHTSVLFRDTPVQQALTPSNREVVRAALGGIGGVSIED